MKTILDLETELGACDFTGLGVTPGRTAVWSVCIHTTASCSPCGGGNVLLKVNQRCFLRSGMDVSQQPWINPRMRMEITRASEDQLLQLATDEHESFAELVNATIPAFADWQGAV